MNDIKVDWNAVLVDLLKHNIDWVIANLDKVNFGNRDFLIKTTIRLILRKVQTALITKNYMMHFEDLRENLTTMIKDAE